ncbi:glycosyltransferase family 8 protein [Dolichospermum circinale]|uniref:glycosyltransferase family 8 protein n=1 Tax=Dolichospermum circinale TaxID=109265 RepID=UPI00232A92B1|nr:glycosyltransferase family 8 protein [Dolichospermum circinale]MDB9449950.1 glycosyltransferase family 8 protein [Dolichospermum circinale CS-547]
MTIPVDNLNCHKSDSILENNLIEPIVVVCAADHNYAMPLAVTVRSALVNLKSQRKILLFIIDGGIKNNNKQKILKSLNLENCEIQFILKPDSWLELIEFNNLEKNQNQIHSLSPSFATYYRLMIAELLPKKFDKAIYLDCDLVVNGDLEELWETDLVENHILAVPDLIIQDVLSPAELANYKNIGISQAKYFNAGVLVINLKKWRDDKIAIQSIEYLKQNNEYIRFHDQDVLNALFVNKWGELNPRWNVMSSIKAFYPSWENSPFSEEVYNTLIRQPYIIHYLTDKKPWTSRHTLLKEYFFEYVDMTAWSGWRLTIWRRIWRKLKLVYKAKIIDIRSNKGIKSP